MEPGPRTEGKSATRPPRPRNEPQRAPHNPVRADNRGSWLGSDGSERFGLTGRILARVFMFVAPVLLLALMAAGVLYVRLLHGPIPLKFMAGPIERGINAELGQLQADVDDAVLRLADKGGFEFQLINLKLKDSTGAAVASAPLAAVELSPSALMSLRIAPRRVDLIEPRLSLSYAKDTGLTLRFAQTSAPALAPDGSVPEPAPTSLGDPGPTGAPAAPLGADGAVSLKRIDLARVLAETSARARRGLDATSELRELGLRNATVTVDHDGGSSQWIVTELAIDLEHRATRSAMSGIARIASERGPWALTFRADDSEKTGLVNVKGSVRDLVPSMLSDAFPQLAMLANFDMPVAGDASLALSASGDLSSATLALEIGAGKVRLGPGSPQPVDVEAGVIHLDYDATARRLNLSPSTLKWGGSFLTLKGAMWAEAGEMWPYQMEASDGALAAEEFGIAPVKLDTWSLNGRYDPQQSLLSIERWLVKGGGAEFQLAGVIDTSSTGTRTRIAADATPMSVDVAKSFWPRPLAPVARLWFGEHVNTGSLASFSIRAGATGEAGWPAPRTDGAMPLLIAMEARDLEIVPVRGSAPARVPLISLRSENKALAVSVPVAEFTTASGKAVPLTNGRFASSDFEVDVPFVDLSVSTKAGLQPIIEVISQFPGSMGDSVRALPAGLDGRVDAQVSVRAPLMDNIDPLLLKVGGKVRIADIRSPQKIEGAEVQGGTIDVELAETSMQAKGELIVNGVVAKLEGQRVFEAPDDMQPPVKLTAVLDNADRNQLGFDINDIVQGDVPVEITMSRPAVGPPKVHVRADLTKANLAIEELAWQKAPGKPARVEFDVAAGKVHKFELQNFKVIGDEIAVEGMVAIGADNRTREFEFSTFALNVVSRLEVKGSLDSTNLWAIKARGATYDGREFFKSIFAVTGRDDQRPKAKNPARGADITAEIDNVLGHNDASLRSMRVKLSERGDKLTALDVRADLNSGRPLAIVLAQQNAKAPRILYAESTDAGLAMRLIGFYSSMQDGRLRLEVNLDGSGAADKAGTLWVEKFKVLGDPVVAQVFSSVGDTGSPAIAEVGSGNSKVVREVFEFDVMRAPFSIGFDQVVLDEAYVRGPLVGATVRGKVDFGAKRVNIGGTYIPLQGLNNVLGGVPLLGELLSGPRGEGIFGITFAIQGSMAQPQVIVNPLSLVAPGIFREMFQMTQSNPKILRREGQAPDGPVEGRVRSSSSSAASREGATGVDGWDSETVVPSTKR